MTRFQVVPQALPTSEWRDLYVLDFDYGRAFKHIIAKQVKVYRVLDRSGIRYELVRNGLIEEVVSVGEQPSQVVFSSPIRGTKRTLDFGYLMDCDAVV